MANGKSTSFYIGADTLIKLDQVAIAARRSDGSDANRSTVVEQLINQAYTNLKRIEPIKNGNKTVGWAAYYGAHCVGEFDGAASKPAAQLALDAYVYEELSR